MTKKLKQKSIIKKQNLEDNKILDYYIKENSNLTNTNTNNLIIDDQHRQQLKLKLKNTITQKNKNRMNPRQNQFGDYSKEVQQLMNHPLMNKNILNLYMKAVSSKLYTNIPTPIQIFDNKEYFLKIYYQYILGLLNLIKEKQLNLNSLDKLLDNPYSLYLSKCLGCPLNPFTK